MSNTSDKNYVPEPIDTSDVKLSGDLLELSKLLAKNNHEVWARQRMKDGWRFGPARNDQRREHPSLVPYEKLPELEKKYDDIVVLEMIKAIIVMGYRIAVPITDS